VSIYECHLLAIWRRFFDLLALAASSETRTRYMAET